MKKCLKLMSVSLLILLLIGSATAVAAQKSISPPVYHVQYIDDMNYIWVDENGNEVDIESSAEPELSMDGAVNLPSSYDSRINDGITQAVVSQGSTGACGAFSSMASLETDAVKRGMYSPGGINLSEAHLMWFANNSATSNIFDSTYGDGYNNPNPYGQGISWRDVTATLARGSGAALDSKYPYSSNISSMGNYGEAARYVCDVALSESEHLPDNNLDVMKQEIMEHGAIQICYKNDYNKYVSSSAGYCYYYPTDETITHAVAIIGWDDNFAKTNFGSVQPASNGAFLCKNSWGTNWGNSGYFWLSYCDHSMEYAVAYSAGMKDYDKLYQYDAEGYYYTMPNVEGKSIESANIFTASGNDYLNKVGFYTIQDNVNYVVRVYKNVTSTGPETGTLLCSLTGSEKYGGYHTIQLDNSYYLAQGTKFSVVVELISQTSTAASSASVAFEGTPNAAANKNFSSKEGESWMNYGYGWWDLYSRNYNSVCIKAYTSDTGTICTHNYSVTDTVAPSCHTYGYDVETCSICHRSKEANIVPATHPWNEGVVTKAASCTATGEKLFTCTLCNETKTEVIPLNSHVLVRSVLTAPDCTSQGQYKDACKNCTYYVTGQIAALGHDYQKTVVAATCVNSGYDSYQCSRCTSNYTQSNGNAALGHSWNEGVVTTAATCAKEGVKTYTCLRCEETKTESIAKAAHSYVKVTVAATCTEAGYDEYTCSVCYDKYTNANGNTALGHSWNEGAVTTAATCAKEGVKTFTCLRCEEAKTESIAKAAHSYVKVTVSATCTEAGYDEYTCSVCSDKYTNANGNAALGHSWNEGTVTTAATCAKEGVKTYTCVRCSSTRTEAVAKPAHNYAVVNSVSAGCENEGYDVYKCSNCSSTYNQQTSLALGHVDSNSDGRCDRCSKLTCSCMCHSSGFKQFIYKIVLLFWKMFGTNKTCQCGKSHY